MSREKSDSGGGLSLQTLLISAISSVAAAVLVPLFWQKGTLIATALTPVIVAVVSEALHKPAQAISAAAPRVTRRTATGAAIRRFDPTAADTRHPENVGARGSGPERFDPLPPTERTEPVALSPDDPFGLRGAERPRRAWWKIGIATGLLAFLIGAAVVTASELTLFGGSVSGQQGKATTLFGGHSTRHRKRHAPPQETATPTPTATPGAEATPTPTPSATASPTPTATPTPPPPAQPTPQLAPSPAPTP